jgi:uncharacterized membrane protein
MKSKASVEGAFAFGVAVLAFSGVARADLRFCNDTPVAISTAVGWQEGDAWKGKGWFNLQPGACQTVLGGDLVFRNYLYYGQAADGHVWGSNYTMCTLHDAFETVISQDCEARGFSTTGARLMDVGEALDTSFTFQCSDCAEDSGTNKAANGTWSISNLEVGFPCSLAAAAIPRSGEFGANLQLGSSSAKISSDDGAYSCSVRGTAGSMSALDDCVFSAGGGPWRSSITCPAAGINAQRVGESLHLTAGGCWTDAGCGASADLDVRMTPR